MKKIWILAAQVVFGVGTSVLAAQQTAFLPTIASANLPLYPRAIRVARIQGAAQLHVFTDGAKVSDVKVDGGPPMLVKAALENVKTWQFEAHKPTNFRVTFHYELLPPSKCDSQCNCDSEETETLLFKLPTEVKISAKIPSLCDPLGKIDREP